MSRIAAAMPRAGACMLVLPLLAGVPAAVAQIPPADSTPADVVPGALEILTPSGADPAAVSGDGFLSPDVAFRVSAAASGGDAVIVRWQLAPTYYLYRKAFRFRVPGGHRAVLGEPRLPLATRKHDPWFGEVDVYYGDVAVELPVVRAPPAGTPLRLEVHYQGCTDLGLCYPPTSRVLQVVMPGKR